MSEKVANIVIAFLMIVLTLGTVFGPAYFLEKRRELCKSHREGKDFHFLDHVHIVSGFYKNHQARIIAQSGWTNGPDNCSVALYEVEFITNLKLHRVEVGAHHLKGF